MIQFHQISKTFDDNDFVLGDISFHIEEGEFVFLIGPSGSGKTTLIKLLIREEAPSRGKIYFDDYDITKLSRNSIYKLRRYIGVIFQDYKLIPDKTVYENVAFALEVAGKTNREIEETVPYLLDIVGLTERSDAFPEYLSGGEKQRVAIARAVSNNPRVLIADEPTGNLDPGAAWDIVQILSKINNWGTTVIMSTHGTDIVNTLNKRVIQMHGGRIIRDDSKGGYEITSRFIKPKKTEEIGVEVKSVKKKRGPIKVRIRASSSTKQEEEKKKGGLFSWFRRSKEDEIEIPNKPESTFTKPKTEEEKQAAKQEFRETVEEPLKEVGEEEVGEIMADADKTSVDKLDLRPEIIADLKSAGYTDVEDIISAGPEKLAEELIIDPEEVISVAQALQEFLGEEEEKLKGGKEKGNKEARDIKDDKRRLKTGKSAKKSKTIKAIKNNEGEVNGREVKEAEDSSTPSQGSKRPLKTMKKGKLAKKKSS